jgi:hypothetical protein
MGAQPGGRRYTSNLQFQNEGALVITRINKHEYKNIYLNIILGVFTRIFAGSM